MRRLNFPVDSQAVASVAMEMGLDSLALISSNHKVIQSFLSEATAIGIRVPRILELDPEEYKTQAMQVDSFLRHLAKENSAVVLLVQAHEAVAIAEHLNIQPYKPKVTWLIGSLGLDLNKLSNWRKVFHNGIFIEPHMPELLEFKNYFMDALLNPSGVLEKSIREYKEEMFGCTHDVFTEDFLVHCDQIPLYELDLRYHQDPHVSFIIKAVSALTAAFRLVQLDHCTDNIKSSCLRKIHPDLHNDISSNLKKLSFSSMMPKGSNEQDGDSKSTEHHFKSNGHMVASKQHVFFIDQDAGLTKVSKTKYHKVLSDS